MFKGIFFYPNETSSASHWWIYKKAIRRNAAGTDDCRDQFSRLSGIPESPNRPTPFGEVNLCTPEAPPRSRVISEGVEKQIYTALEESIYIPLLLQLSLAKTWSLKLSVSGTRLTPAAVGFKYVLMNNRSGNNEIICSDIYYLFAFLRWRNQCAWRNQYGVFLCCSTWKTFKSAVAHDNFPLNFTLY